MRKIMPMLFVCLSLSGCTMPTFWVPEPLTNVVLGSTSVLSYSVLGKGPIDYAYSEYKDQNCDFRNIKREGQYCVAKNPPAPPPQPALYCYRSLGTPDCSRQIDPYDNGNKPIVDSPNSLVKPLPLAQKPSDTALIPYKGGQEVKPPRAAPLLMKPDEDPALKGS